MKGSCYRQIQTLRTIPVWPSRISTSELASTLSAQGIDIHVRSLQRDLKSLAKLFDIQNDGSKDIPGWYWEKDADKLELPEMEPSVALSFNMVNEFLERFMPKTTMKELTPYFSKSNQILNALENNNLNDWSSKVALLSRNQSLISPEIDEDVLAVVYEALLTENQVNATYKPRNVDSREYSINPLGIVVVDQIIYLVGTLWEYKDIKQFALHRFSFAEITKSKSIKPDNFDLKSYINAGHFEYVLEGDEMIHLKLKINKGIAKHLSESKISDDQKIIQEDNNFTLTATTKNTHQLRWWLLSFGDGVEVIEPMKLRSEFEEISNSLTKIYSK